MKKAGPSTGHPRLRRLSDEEIELWLTVTRNVEARPGMRLPRLPEEERPDATAETQPAGKPPGGIMTPKPVVTAQKPQIPALAPLDRRMRQKLSRGRTAADAVIDLHGMRQHEAFSALHNFLARAQREGAKLVLVVTGKGERHQTEHFENNAGVLRRSVPHWLRSLELRSIVVGFEEASRPHGGAGALYVKIRRRERVSSMGFPKS